jgi:hypothetical protein
VVHDEVPLLPLFTNNHSYDDTIRSLSVTLLSRLMLNLHDTGVARIDTNLSDLETIRFTDMRRTSVTE